MDNIIHVERNNDKWMKKGAYGIVYQEIMRSPELPGNSKLIYAYLAAFAGNGDECYPSV